MIEPSKKINKVWLQCLYKVGMHRYGNFDPIMFDVSDILHVHIFTFEGLNLLSTKALHTEGATSYGAQKLKTIAFNGGEMKPVFNL